MTGPKLIVALPGSGDITVTGTTSNATITLLGSGNIYCDGLKAHSVGVQIMGSGNVTTYADESLDASILGSGNIRYSGQPAQVTKDIKVSDPEPSIWPGARLARINHEYSHGVSIQLIERK